MATGDQNFNWGSLLGSLGSLAGAGINTAAQSSQNSTAQQMAQTASQFGPFGATGQGGIGGTYGNNQFGLNLGSLANPYSQFAGLAGSNLSAAGGVNGLPSTVSNANFMTPSLANAFGLASNQLTGPASSTANTAFVGAGNQAQLASQDPTAYANSVYQNLTQQAAPWEQKQLNDLTDSEFARGQLGSTGGALQTQAFAQGLGTADLQRQLQAQSLAQTNQNNAATRASTLGGLGNSLLSNAFGNFNNITNTGVNNLGAQSSLSFLPANLQGAYLGNANSSLSGANNAQQSALNLFNTGLNTQTQNSAAAARGGQLAAYLANGQNTAGSPVGQLLQGLFGGMANNAGSTGGILGSLLGGNNGSGGILQSLFGGGSGTNLSNAITGMVGGQDYSSLIPAAQNLDLSGDLSSIFGSFSSAGGQAAGGSLGDLAAAAGATGPIGALGSGLLGGGAADTAGTGATVAVSSTPEQIGAYSATAPAADSGAADAAATGLTGGNIAALGIGAGATAYTLSQLWNAYQNDPNLAATNLMTSVQGVDPALYSQLQTAYQQNGGQGIRDIMSQLFGVAGGNTGGAASNMGLAPTPRTPRASTVQM